MSAIFQLWASLLVAAAGLTNSIGNGQTLTDDEKTALLQCINLARKSTIPKAANMNALIWDANLESLAQAAADKCVFQHYYDGPYANLGEVVYSGGNTDSCYIINFMILEAEGYNYTTGQCTQTKYPFFNTCGHYLQVVTAAISKVGCARRLCNGNYLFYCEFNRGYTVPPFKAGEPGTQCGELFASFHIDRLCYYFPYTGSPVPPPADCRLRCLNYGKLSETASIACQCTCPVGFSGFSCETKLNDLGKIPNDCTAQAVTCKNQGSPTMFADAKCKCVCPSNFKGDDCEVNIEQSDNSLAICVGGKSIYQSYWIIPETAFTPEVRSNVKTSLVDGVNAYCRGNYAACCPSQSQTLVDPFVASGDCLDTDNYPIRESDGALCFGVYFQLNPTLAAQCWSKATAYLPKSVLLSVWNQVATSVRAIIVQGGLQFCRVK